MNKQNFLKDMFLIIIAIIIAYFLNKIPKYFTLNISGELINLSLAIISLLILFVLQLETLEKNSLMFVYSKKLHSLVENKYKFFIGKHMTFRLFLIIFSLTNIIIVLLKNLNFL